MSGTILLVIAYAAAAVFLVAFTLKALKIASLPVHLRWELAPVAHEGSKAKYGGSYFEEFEWWTKPREVSMAGELKVMIPEILFLVALWEHNRKLWRSSFPFHFGLYLVIASTMLMIAAAILIGVLPSLASLHHLLRTGAAVLGVAGLCLGILGALGLLWKRLSLPELREYTARADIFNLGFFVVAFGSALLNFLTADRSFFQVSSFIDNLVKFRLETLPGAEPGAGLLPGRLDHWCRWPQPPRKQCWPRTPYECAGRELDRVQSLAHVFVPI